MSKSGVLIILVISVCFSEDISTATWFPSSDGSKKVTITSLDINGAFNFITDGLFTVGSMQYSCGDFNTNNFTRFQLDSTIQNYKTLYAAIMLAYTNGQHILIHIPIQHVPSCCDIYIDRIKVIP